MVLAFASLSVKILDQLTILAFLKLDGLCTCDGCHQEKEGESSENKLGEHD